MSSFRYSARTHEGDVQTGIVDAGSREAAITILQQHRLIITGLTEVAEGGIGETVRRQLLERITRKDIVIFSRQLAILFEARVPLLESLNTLADQTGNRLFARMIRLIAADVDSGVPFSDALAKHPRQFSVFYVNMARSGEASGKLQEVFSYLADYLERQYALISKIRGAMIYPAFILVVFAVVGTIVFLEVLPQIASVFAQENANLPVLTRTLLSFSNIFRATWIWWMGSAALVVFGSVRFLRTSAGRQWFDAHLLSVPIVGNIYRAMLMARFADNFGTLISAGVPIVQSLEITSSVVGNIIFQEALARTVESVKRGEKIHASLKLSSVVPPMVVQMISVGERTGKLETILSHIARFYDREVDRTTDNLVSIIEPAIIVVLGLFVGIFVATILLPIYNLSQAIGG